MSDVEFVTLKDLSVEFGVDRSHMRRYIKDRGFDMLRVRTVDSRSQLTLAVTAQDAELVREKRKDEGFCNSPTAQSEDGFFYIIAVVPDLDKNRIKLGFATNVKARLDSHRTSSPTAKLIKSWPCKRAWEISAIACITRVECSVIGGEVYQCSFVPNAITRAEEFFSIMPDLRAQNKK